MENVDEVKLWEYVDMLWFKIICCEQAYVSHMGARYVGDGTRDTLFMLYRTMDGSTRYLECTFHDRQKSNTAYAIRFFLAPYFFTYNTQSSGTMGFYVKSTLDYNTMVTPNKFITLTEIPYMLCTPKTPRCEYSHTFTTPLRMPFTLDKSRSDSWIDICVSQKIEKFKLKRKHIQWRELTHKESQPSQELPASSLSTSSPVSEKSNEVSVLGQLLK